MRVVFAWSLLTTTVIGWPVSAFWLARDEPPFVLGLSWLAIVIASLDFLTTSQVHKDQGDPDQQ